MGRNILITGGSKGIGKAIVEKFVENGDNVIFTYFTSEENAKKIEKDILDQGNFAIAMFCDVRNRYNVKDVVNYVHDKFGNIDVLVNNAGISQYKLFTDINDEEWDDVINVNLNGAYNFLKNSLPKMIEEKRGKVINISSIWGITGASLEVAYSTSKAALIGFTKSLAKELAPSNIQINAVAPGVIDTDMNDFSESDMKAIIDEIPMMRMGMKEEIASVVFFLAGKDADYITGQVISPNGGMVI
jgi:3-oxoacyl-[acyl-carrier protein] reductase